MRATIDCSGTEAGKVYKVGINSDGLLSLGGSICTCDTTWDIISSPKFTFAAVRKYSDTRELGKKAPGILDTLPLEIEVELTVGGKRYKGVAVEK